MNVNQVLYVQIIDGYYVDLNQCLSSDKKFVDTRNICSDKCPENDIRQKIEYFHEAYTYLKNCGDKFIINNNNYDEPECVEYCPKELNHIGKDNICKRSREESDGIYYYRANNNIYNINVSNNVGQIIPRISLPNNK